MSDSEKQIPQKIKLDLLTPLEQFFLGLMIISPVMIFVGFSQLKLGDTPVLLVGAVITFVLSFLCYLATDNYYVLDIGKRQLLYRFKFLIFERVSKVVDFSGIHAITINNITLRGKGKVSYVYVPELILFDGRVLPIADSKSNKIEMQKLARTIANASGADFVPSPGTTEMLPTRLPGGRYTFKPKTYKFSASQEVLWRIGAVIMILVCVPFIGMVIFHFIWGR